jgi:hypothetical protein
MKAITVTTVLKQSNAEIFAGQNVGAIRTFNNIPRTFSSLTYNTGQRTDGYNTLDNSTHEADGFYDVITPAYDLSIEKLGVLFFNTTNFTYPVIVLTQPEIDARVDGIEDNIAGETEGTRGQDGTEEGKFIFKYLRKLNNNGTITNNQFKAAQDLLFDALLPMTYGLWDVTEDRLLAIPDPTNNTLLSILNEIRNRISSYITNNIT